MSRRRELNTMLQLIYDGIYFFIKTRCVHAVIAVVFLATGITSLVLSLGANGTAKIPYYFSAFVACVWQVMLAVTSQVCLYLLAPDGSRSAKASQGVVVYSFSSSLFVLFNVMGVVFSVVNGLCLAGQMCYYDNNMRANRAMAILLMVEHCACILLSVFLAKRAHVIDARLKSDVEIRLNQPFVFYQQENTVTPITQTIETTVTLTSGSPTSDDNLDHQRESEGTPELHHVQTDNEGHVMSTVEILAKRRKHRAHRKSKSIPNMKGSGIKLEDLDGDVFSIFSDSEVKDSQEKRRRKIKVFRVRNKVSVINKKPEVVSSDEEETHRRKVEIVQTTTVSVKTSGKITKVKSALPDEDTLSDTGTFVELDSPPPPYEADDNTTKVM